MENNRKKKIEESLNIIAERERISTEEVKEEMARAISIALKSKDNDIQHFWQDVPCEGPAPTIEEIIDYLAEKIAGR